MKRITTQTFLVCFLFLSLPLILRSQITIGSDKPPVKAGLLQLKQWESEDNIDPNDFSNSTKGLGLPRVALKSLDSLEPFLNPNDSEYEDKKKDNEGLLVFNLTEDPINNLFPRIYIWNGTLWKEYVLRTSELSLEVSPDVLTHDFSVSNPQPFNVNLKWEPAPIATEIILDPKSGGGLQGLESIARQTDVSGNYSFAIKPTAMSQAELEADPLIERTTEMHFRTSNGAGAFLLQSIMLKQINYGIIVEGIEPYMEMGRDYYVTIKSNTPWKLGITTPKGDSNTFEIQEIPTDGLGSITKEGVKYKLRLKESLALERDQIVFTFSSPDGKFTNQVIKFEPTRTYANSYIATPGSVLEIPLKKAYIVWANDLKEPLADNATFTAELLWQDKSNLIQSLSNESLGVESKFKVQLRSGVPSGNALIGAKNSAGEIVWSWHLWVTDYNPNKDLGGSDIDFESLPEGVTVRRPTEGGDVYSYFNGGRRTTHFMDRELGSLDVWKEGYTTYTAALGGFHYQYGRKDPFTGGDYDNYLPHGGTITNQVHNSLKRKPIYNLAGERLQDGSEGDGWNNILDYNADKGNGILVIKVSELEEEENKYGNLLRYSIKSPQVLLSPIDGGNDFDWISRREFHREDLWNRSDNTKGLYDPCPQGWRVPVGGLGLDNPFYGIPNTMPMNGILKSPLSTSRFANDARSQIGFLFPNGYIGIGGVYKGYLSDPLTHVFLRMSEAKDARSYLFRLARTPTNIVNNKNMSEVLVTNMSARGHGVGVRCVKYYNDSNY